MRVAGWVLIGVPFSGAAAQAAEPAPELRQRAAELVGWANGETAPARLFAPSFLAAVPEAQLKTITDQLHGSYGAAKNVAGIEAATGDSGIVRLAFDKAVLRLTLVVDPAPPHLVTGLLFGGVESAAGTPESVATEMAALTGEVSLVAANLGDGPPQILLDRRAEAPMAVGSAFKLWVLAELSREVRAGERHWSDVVTLDRASLPSSLLRRWPAGSPVTLHTLAALMISQSDNTAADRLVEVLGRERIERLLPTLGVRAAARDRPLLLTRELALLKADPALRQRWLAADEAGRRAVLGGIVGGGGSENDLNPFSAPPKAGG